MESVIQPLAKSVLIPLELTATASAADIGILKRILVSGHNTTLKYQIINGRHYKNS